MRHSEPVSVSSEMHRVLDLPRLAPGLEREVPRWVYDKNTRPGAQMTLRPLQALALFEAHEAGGLIGNITVGEGKTLISGLLPNMVSLPEGRDAHLFVPASAVDKTYKELEEYDEHFRISRRLWVHSYGSLSNIRTGPDLMDQLQPGALLFDECHKLANVESVSWLRVMRWLEENPETYVFGFSGTVMKTKIEDFAHLMAAALREGSPVPMEYDAIQPWSKTVGEDTAISFARNADWIDMQPLVDEFGDKRPLIGRKRNERKDAVREAFLRRLDTCRGIVLSKKQSTNTHLSIEVVSCDMPVPVLEAIEGLQEDWVRPDGEYLNSGLEVSAVGLQLSQGFHYYWDWPDEPDREWLEARASFNKEVGRIVRAKRRGLDSPGQVYKKMRQNAALLALVDMAAKGDLSPVVLAGLAPRAGLTPALRQAAELGDLGKTLYDPETGLIDVDPTGETLARWRNETAQPATAAPGLTIGLWDAADDWFDERVKPQPPTATAWIDYFLLEDVMRRVEETDEPTLVWYGHTAVADALGLMGLEVCRPKEDPDPERPRNLAVSIKSHNTGLNLQAWRRNIVVCPPSSALDWEQLLGRTHRQNQEEDVEVIVYGSSVFMRAALVKAVRRARSIQQMKGLPQRLCTAEWKGLDLSKEID